jgi:hypothetical protein
MKQFIFAAAMMVSDVMAKSKPIPRVPQCGNENIQTPSALLKSYRDIAKVNSPLQQVAAQIAAAPLLPINIYYHVIANTTAQARTITRAMLTNQTRILNTAYLNTGFKFSYINTTYTGNPLWANGGRNGTDPTDEYALKTMLRIGDYSDLNIYVVSELYNTYEAYGRCEFPVFINSSYPEKDPFPPIVLNGCTLDFSTIPGGPVTKRKVNEGKTAIHEVGHWLGLIHVWGETVGCSGSDDVDDTPAQYGPTVMTGDEKECPTPRNTCPTPGPDDNSNYMDYSADFCLTHFTPGQIVRMNRLWSLRVS